MTQTPKWKCRDGREIAVADMETGHIQSALVMLKRKGFIGPRTLGAYMCNPDLPDGAAALFEQEQDRAFSSPVSPFVDIFEQELKRRAAPRNCPVCRGPAHPGAHCKPLEAHDNGPTHRHISEHP